MDRNARIFVAGHKGLVGSAIMRRLADEGARNVTTRSHAELDLGNQAAVECFFASERPDYVFLAAARVGGIHANATHPAGFIHDNLAIQTNVIHAAWRYGVKRLLFLGSSCIYPRDCPQPIKEEYLLTGPLEPTNRAYAIAKIAGVEMCRAYNLEHGTRFLAAMPTNLYGPGDNYVEGGGHVIPALLKRFHDAASSNDATVVVWGTGRPRREFLHSDDLAAALILLMGLPDVEFDQRFGPEAMDVPLVNVGSGQELRIAELASVIAAVTGFKGSITFDSDWPDGTPRKLLDSTNVRSIGWAPSVPLREGLARTYADVARLLTQ